MWPFVFMSDADRCYAHCLHVHVSPTVRRPSLAEHLPEQGATGLRQHGIDEQVLLLQRLGERATRSGVFLVDGRITYFFRDDVQLWYGYELFWRWLADFVAHSPDNYLPLNCALPKSIQYSGVLWSLFLTSRCFFRKRHRSRRERTLSVQVKVMLAVIVSPVRQG